MKANDGWLVLGANSQRLWRTLCDSLERPELAADPRFAAIADRLANRPALIEELERTFAERSVAEWVARLLGAGIPAGPILNHAEALASDHAAARNIVMEIDHPVEGKVRSIGFPVKMNGTPQTVRRPPPLLGEHTTAIVAELDMDEPSLRAAGAFGL